MENRENHEITGRSIPEFLMRRVDAAPDAIAFLKREEGRGWRGVTWAEFFLDVRGLWADLTARGLLPGDQVGILMKNSVEWETAQHAVFMSGAVVVGLDGNDPGERLKKILELTDIKVLFIDNAALLDRFPRDFLESLKFIVEKAENSAAPGGRELKNRISFSRAGQSPPVSPLPNHGGDVPATIIFTSGTTGDPKAISYNHGQLALAARAIIRRAPAMPEQARSICWLPLASPFQRIINYCSIIGNWQSFIVSDPAEIMERIGEIHPHFFAAVPRFYEKVYEGIEQKIKESPRWMRRVVDSAIRFGMRCREAERNGEWTGPLSTLRHAVARRLVLNKFRNLMGREIRFLLSGSAPMNHELLKKFHAMGWLILESYGVSENIVPIGMNTPDHYRFGSVGKSLEENRIKISPRGTVAMKGPGVSTSIPVTDEDGFVDTGDLGEIDAQGYLWLKGRNSDAFKLSTGRKIIPSGIEAALNRMDLVEYGVAMGESRKYVTALLNMDPEKWTALIKRLSSKEKAKKWLKREVVRQCRDIPAYARPVKIRVTLARFSIQTGELTGNLKLRRKFVIEKHQHSNDSSTFFL